MNTHDSLSFFESHYTWIAGYNRNVIRYGDKLAMVSPKVNKEWTYSEFNSEVNRLSNALMQDGFQRGEVIMLLLPNCPAFAFSYVAAHKIHGVCCPVNYRLSSGELSEYLENSRPKALLFDDTYSDIVLMATRLSSFCPKRLISVGGATVGDIISFEDYVCHSSDEEPPYTCEYNIYDETTRIYTSGTTGKPKGIPLMSINELLSAHDQMINLSISHKDVTMNTTPWFHRGGLHSTGPCPAFYAGATIIVMEKFEPEVALKYVQKYKVTFFVGVPTVLDQLADLQEHFNYDLTSLRGISSMGSPLDRSRCIRYQKILTPNIYNAYGISEMHAVTLLQPSDLPEYAGTAGGPCGEIDVRVVKTYDTHRAEPDDMVADDGIEVGEVIASSPAYSPYCYFDNEEETDRRYYNGYFYSNDLAVWDKKKYITIVGRRDDLIISSGENIYPNEVEAILNNHPKVKESIVTSVPDEIRGQIVAAYVVREDDTLTVAELDAFCKQSPYLANFKRPRYYRFVDDIPYTALGKKHHTKIREIALWDFNNAVLTKV